MICLVADVIPTLTPDLGRSAAVAELALGAHPAARLSGGGICSCDISDEGSSGPYDALRVKLYALDPLLDPVLSEHDADRCYCGGQSLALSGFVAVEDVSMFFCPPGTVK